jgi:hypothetical protein
MKIQAKFESKDEAHLEKECSSNHKVELEFFINKATLRIDKSKIQNLKFPFIGNTGRIPNADYFF